jgi:phosphatidylserine/phosphatidylglycerophosphate/cardiolipin synthase-like enzyme
LLVALVLLGAGCEGNAERESGGRRVPAGVLLARPAEEGREEHNPTFRVLLRLIRETPAGERIRIVGNSFSFVPAAEALVEAHRRGVRVQVVVDRVSREWRAPALLGSALGTDPRAGSFLQLARGSVHQKVWSFTRTGRSRDVVLVGSMNLTYYSARQYTDVHAYVGRPRVRRVFDRRFEQLSRRLPSVPSMRPASFGRDRVWFYPGYDQASDPVRRLLADVPAAGSRIRVVMYAWLDERGLGLAELLAAKDAAGADVEVVLGRSVGERVRALLEDSGVEVHPGVFADGDDVHHKLTVVSYRDGAGVRRGFVLTGSDNYTTRSLDRPEVLLRLGAAPTVRRYERWVDRLVARGAREAR